MKTEIELLEERIRQIKEAQLCCNHTWGVTEYEPEGIFDKDFYNKYPWTNGYRCISRWSRTCDKCGKKEYTYETTPAVNEYGFKVLKRAKF